MNTTPQAVFRFLIGVAIAAAICFLVWYFSSVVIYVLVSAVLAIICRPVVRHLTALSIRGRHLSRGLSAAITLLLIWVIFALLGTLLVPMISGKVVQLSQIDLHSALTAVGEPIRRAQEYLHRFLPLASSEGFSLKEVLVEGLQSMVGPSTLNAAVTSIAGFIGSFVISFFSISFITFFFMKEDDLFFSMVRAMFPDRYAENVSRAMESVTRLLSRYFTGILTESLILMTVITLVMSLFGMHVQDALFIGFIMGVMNVIPYAGPVIGGVMSVFMGMINPIEGMTVGHTMLLVACTLLVIKGIDDFVLQPTIYSERVNAHPLEVFLVILLAGSLAGIVGMLLAIPAYTVLRVFAKEFFSQFSLVRKLTQQI
ncbi:MAG: AI-2E family transporter [Alistipes sp.]|nr:AI-2E family transporter [Alistipes sp.]